MDNYFIALQPGQELDALINSHKTSVINLVGKQKWLDHPPKITSYIFATDKESEIVQILEYFSKNISSLVVNIVGLHVFEEDARSSGKTITYELDKESMQSLRKIQKDIIDLVLPFNDKQVFSRKIDIKRLSQIEQKNLREYGYPYIGDGWIPHFTLGSIEPDKYNEVFEYISKKPITGAYPINYLCLYRDLDHPVLVRKWKV